MHEREVFQAVHAAQTDESSSAEGWIEYLHWLGGGPFPGGGEAPKVEFNLEKTPEYQRMMLRQEETCDRCGEALGPSRIQITIDRAIHAGGCPRDKVTEEEPKEFDSFGKEISRGSPTFVDTLAAKLPIAVKK